MRFANTKFSRLIHSGSGMEIVGSANYSNFTKSRITMSLLLVYFDSKSKSNVEFG